MPSCFSYAGLGCMLQKNQYQELLLGNTCEMFKHFAVNLKKVMRSLSASALVLFISDMKHLTSFSHSILIHDDLIWSQKKTNQKSNYIQLGTLKKFLQFS